MAASLAQWRSFRLRERPYLKKKKKILESHQGETPEIGPWPTHTQTDTLIHVHAHMLTLTHIPHIHNTRHTLNQPINE